MSHLHARMLQRAVHKLGGTAELAHYLDVPEVRVRVWLHGLMPLPDDVFLRLVDLLEDPPPASPGEARAPGRKGS